MPPLAPRPTASRAARILKEAFAGIEGRFAFRLWDGTEVPFGAPPPLATAVIKSPEVFVRLMRDPTPYQFAEAYVGGAIDIEGDLFATMTVANEVENIRMSRPMRLRLLLSMWRP
jgi:cyclopropane-fatty-acyl-phospholipid synthase